MGYCLQLKLLIWKNFVIRKRQKIRLIVELVWPLVLFLILTWVRTRGLKEYVHECHFQQKVMPSSGPEEFFYNFLCTLNNTCHRTLADATRDADRYDTNFLMHNIINDLENVVSSDMPLWDNTSIYSIYRDMKALSNLIRKMKIHHDELTGSIKIGNILPDKEAVRRQIIQENIPIKMKSFDALMNSEISVHDLYLNLWQIEPKVLFCNETLLSRVLSTSSPEDVKDIGNDLCSIPSSNLTRLISILRNELNSTGLMSEITNYVKSNVGHTVDWNQWQEMNNIAKRLLMSYSKTKSFGEIMNGSVNFIKQYRQAVVASYEMNISYIYTNILVLQQLLCGHNAEGVHSLLRNKEKAAGFGSFKDVIRELDKENGEYVEDPEATPECNNLFRKLETNPFSQFFWLQVKPFFRGKILFAPVSNITERIMQRVNDYFLAVEKFKDFIKTWVKGNLSKARELALDDIGNLLNIALFSGTEIGEKLFDSFEAMQMGLGNTTLIQVLKRFLTDYTYRMDMFWALSDIGDATTTLLECFDMNKTFGYPSENEATTKAMELLESYKLWGVVIFNNLTVEDDTLPPFITYKIRMDSNRVDNTHAVQDRLRRPGPRRRPAIDLKYITFGFAYLQDLVEQSLIKEQTGVNNTPGIILQQFPYPCYIVDTFIRSISRTFPMFMTLAWVYSCAMIIKSIVVEKERRLKETMRVMGMGNGIHWIAWFIDNLIPMMITALLLTLILVYGKVLQHSDPTLVFTFIMAYGMATISLSFLISVFFSRANLSAAAGGLIFFMTYLPYPFMVLWEQSLSSTPKICCSLLSNVAFGFGCAYFALFEEMGVGMNWQNFHKSPLMGDSYNLLNVMYMLLCDTFLYLLLMWYIENVAPGQYGVPKPLYFPFMKSYWCNADPSYKQEVNIVASNIAGGSGLEEEPRHLTPGVCLHQLTKVYPSGKVAVRNLSLNFYQDQITAFLGHNGAGKTTTISILTGLFPPSSGTATVHGLDIRYEMDTIRQSMGMCPQHNVLFDQLNVEEHLWFFAMLKDRNKEEVRLEIKKMLSDLGLSEKYKCRAQELSGGMQRKLSIAAAFIGNSRTVILDEPTSGVDPFSRRSIWELLVKYKQGRTIILTTHFMDEADILGDRIAIIANGELRCCGSSLFLKNCFGSGYYLTVDMDAPHQSLSNSPIVDMEETQSPSSVHQNSAIEINHVRYISDLVQSQVPTSKLKQCLGTQLIFALPRYDNALSLHQLFDLLDKKKEQHIIKSYGIADTTLEEIFLKVVEKDERTTNVELQQHSEDAKMTMVCRKWIKSHFNFCGSLSKYVPRRKKENLTMRDKVAWSRSSGVLYRTVPVVEVNIASTFKDASEVLYTNNGTLKWKQFQAIIAKHFHHTRRNRKAVFSELIMPAIFVCMALAFTTALPDLQMPPPLLLQPWIYGSSNPIFFHNEQPSVQSARLYEKEILGPVGLGTRCIKTNAKRSEFCKPVNLVNIVGTKNNTFPTVECSCTHGTQQCPKDGTYPDPPSAKASTGDILENVTYYNISDWLVRSTHQYYELRYGGFSFGVHQPESFLNLSELNNTSSSLAFVSHLQALAGNETQEQDEYNYIKVWFNNKGWASSVSYMNAINNAVLRALLPDDKKVRSDTYGFNVINHPLNYTEDELHDELIQQSGISLLHAIAVIFAMSFVPASFVVFLIEERICKSKHLQIVSGVNQIVYWLAAFSWNLMCYTLSSLLCIFVFLLFNEDAYVTHPNLEALAILLLLYGWASIPLMYPASFIFSVPSTAFVALACGNLFIGIITTVATFVLEVFNDEELQYIASVIGQVFLVFPQFCLGRGLMNIAKYHYQAKAISSQFSGLTMHVNVYDWEILGKNFFCMFICGVICFLMTLLIEFKIIKFHRRRIKKEDSPLHQPDEEDVLAERKRVLSNEATEDALLVKELTKVYDGGRNVAVNQICVGVKKGECFGLLGLNGAGKTTTFKMLTGDTKVTSGDAFINGFSILGDMSKVYRRVGYCPQFDALDPLLTAREHLQLYARLRGIPASVQQQIVDSTLQLLGLGHYENRCVGTLSGGNKRKLSTAIAIMGNPRLIFLDEPTTGMDPKARRSLWSCILEIVKQGCSVVLTSHSMEECEALCTKLTIMVNGRFRCFGSSQHLKNKFGRGYIIVIRSSPSDLQQAIDYVETHIPGVHLREYHVNQAKFELPQENISLGEVFKNLEKGHQDFVLQDYSVSQATLEEVFLRFASEQSEGGRETV